MRERAEIGDLERETVAELGLRLTGSKPESEARLESCVVNILRRMQAVNTSTLPSYLKLVASNSDERAQLVSALTIHHTTWFRESVHLDRLKVFALAFAENSEMKGKVFSVLSAGCSSGEEAYSMGLVLQSVRESLPHFDYRIEGWDVDPVSVRTANRAIYAEVALPSIPKLYQDFVLRGTAKTKGLFTLDAKIRERIRFHARSLLDTPVDAEGHFNVVFCRNVLIYFKPEQVRSIIASLIRTIVPKGLLILGHSEAIEAKLFHLKALGNSCYQLGGGEAAKEGSTKPSMAAPGLALSRPELILIGASTGGTEALEKMLRGMPADCPPIVVVQHISHSFAKSFAERLAAIAQLNLGAVEAGGPLKRNHLYMAWGDYHIGVRRQGAAYGLVLSHDPPLHSVRPSVDHLFESASRYPACEKILACILTGMGKDGAAGLLALRRNGSMTVTQDQKSSVVYGMPAEAVALGASQYSGSPEVLRSVLLKAISSS